MNRFSIFLIIVSSCLMQAGNNIPAGFGVSFNLGMSNFEWYRNSWTKTDPDWHLASDLYDQYIVNDLEYSPTPRIPKIIHQIWIGSPLPDKYIPLINSWKLNHPDWEYILWDDVMIDALGLINKDQYDTSTNYGQKADIARYEILYRVGGVYVDIDFECLRPMDIFHHVCDYYTGVAYSGRFSTFNGLIGSTPGNPILKECIDTLDITKYYEGSPEHNILFTSGPFHQTRCYLAKAGEAGRAVAFPVNYFYPWPNAKKDDNENLARWFKPETFAIHYWHASWREQKATQVRYWPFSTDECWESPFCEYEYCLPYFTQQAIAFFGSLWEYIVDETNGYKSDRI